MSCLQLIARCGQSSTVNRASRQSLAHLTSILYYTIAQTSAAHGLAARKLRSRKLASFVKEHEEHQLTSRVEDQIYETERIYARLGDMRARVDVLLLSRRSCYTRGSNECLIESGERIGSVYNIHLGNVPGRIYVRATPRKAAAAAIAIRLVRTDFESRSNISTSRVATAMVAAAIKQLSFSLWRPIV
ncbi:unnamed protein product [Trichogramma brassicae]|uniref:Uncharacterized protein n=1 Tax=Trichogramma brassicae TaxID=86971 RepID=A0A6H5IFP8_9HYME|nr:unnamed protein product [Trichogramma brassicae]